MYHKSSIVVVFFLAIMLISCDENMSSTESESPNTMVETVENVEESSEYKYVDEDTHQGRVNWQKPDTVIGLMGDISGKTVAEIGAGTGFFTFRIVPYAKKTIGIDIDNGILNYLDSIRVNFLPEDVRDKLELRHVSSDDPMIGDGEADIILLANTFVYLPQKAEYLRKLKKSLSNNGKLIIVDFKMHRIAVGPDQDEKLPQYLVENFLLDAGYELVLSDDMILPYQYIIIAK